MLKNVPWPKNGVIKLGWQGSETPYEDKTNEAVWPQVTGLAPRLFHSHLIDNPQWTYNTLGYREG